MQDLDSAVGRLDNILMSLYVVIATLIIAVALVRPSLYVGGLFLMGVIASATVDTRHRRRNPRPWSVLLHTHSRLPTLTSPPA
jgi:hypothetical protein